MITSIDDEIISVLRTRRYMTYVIANILRMENGAIRTSRVLRRLKAMEKLGLVQRAPSSYAAQLCWQVTPRD